MWSPGHLYQADGLLMASFANWIETLFPFVRSVTGTWVAPIVLTAVGLFLIEAFIRRLVKWS